jgi:ribonuclease HIII
MNDDAREIDRLLRDWWLERKDDHQFQRILECALKSETLSRVPSVVPYARAVQVLESRQLRPALKGRLDELRAALHELQQRELQIDMLGDLNNEPQTLFEILGDEASGIKGFASEALRKARLANRESRACAAAALLATLWSSLPPEATSALNRAIDDTTERELQESWGLFIDPVWGQGVALGIQLVVRTTGRGLVASSDIETQQQAKIAAELAGLDEGTWNADVEWSARFTGESIGVPLFIAAQVAQGLLPRHALTASTGQLAIGGAVKAVSGIEAKIEAARRLGMRRVLVPRDNLSRAREIAANSQLIVLPLEHVRDVRAAYWQPISPVEVRYSSLKLLIRATVADYQLAVQDESETSQGCRFTVANASGKASIWVYRNCRVYAQGAPGQVLDAANRLVAEQAPEPINRSNISFFLPTPQMQATYENTLLDAGAVTENTDPNQLWRMQLLRGRSRSFVTLYKTGTCTIHGTAPAWDLAHELAGRVLRTVGGLPSATSPKSTPASAVATNQNVEPHIGTDEAGKGDYFGPLVSAAVYVDAESAETLRKMGVRDSKTLSDRRIRELSEQIRKMPDVKFAVTAINPRKFNELYETFRREGKNLNSLLAWGHGRSIGTLLSLPPNERVHANYVLVDQFADKHYIEERTRKAGIPVHQRPKAEEDIAVAAASVLARDGFVRWLERMSQRTQITLPKGASPQVIEAGKQFVRKWGARWLGEVAKLNFRTTDQVLEGEEKSTRDATPRKLKRFGKMVNFEKQLPNTDKYGLMGILGLVGDMPIAFEN